MAGNGASLDCDDLSPLFEPISIGALALANRIVVSPMTRGRSHGGVLDDAAVKYYSDRARGGAGLIISEGSAINLRGSFSAGVPDFFGDDALAVWRRVIKAVHAAGGLMMPQLWHSGLNRMREQSHDPSVPSLSPSGCYPQWPDKVASGQPLEAMTQAEIDRTIEDYATAAANAKRLDFDGVEIHAGHGYLIDSFFWDRTNLRTDAYGGDYQGRTRLACEIISAVRGRVGPDFPIAFRFSQWKSPDFYTARLCSTPQELEQLLIPLVHAGVDLFDCSTRRFWEAEFPEVDDRLNLAGWTKKITGVRAMTVGSVGIGSPLQRDRPDHGEASLVEVKATLAKLADRLKAEEFDLVAIGRGMIANPDWARKVQQARIHDLVPYDIAMRSEMV
ncbi:MAG TPA: hypothetical protein VJL88_12535 [Nitrospira sp.]|nr:hypothetical protein [Nitrospira sp.]